MTISINKISTIHDNLNSHTLHQPPVGQCYGGSPLTAFHPVSESNVREVLNKTAIKTRELDPPPPSLLAELVDDLLPSFASVINDSLSTGSFPSVFKSAIVRTLLKREKKERKKPALDTKHLKNYRRLQPALPFQDHWKGSLLQLSQHLESNNIFYSLQSACRPGHSKGTALLEIVNDLLAVLDVIHISLLSVLDLSAAIDYSILYSRLHHITSLAFLALLCLGFSHTSLIELSFHFQYFIPFWLTSETMIGVWSLDAGSAPGGGSDAQECLKH